MTEQIQEIINLLKKAVEKLSAETENQKPTLNKGTLIGIGDQRLFFVEEFRDGKMRVMAYSPVGYSRFRILSDCERAIENDDDDVFHQAWEDAVCSRDTEDSYAEFAESKFNDEEDCDNPIWFYGQEFDGEGAERLKTDDELREKVNRDMKDFWDEDVISSWENADSSELPELWEVVYSKEAVDWLERQRKEEN